MSPARLKTSRLSRVFCCFKIDLAAHAVEDLSEMAENVLPDVAGEFALVRRVCAECAR